jgi:hypothetical protein
MKGIEGGMTLTRSESAANRGSLAYKGQVNHAL